jgi:hypothetical protein
MKSTRLAVTDPDLAGAFAALKRAAAAAWRLSVQTDTPFYVIENGRVVDRNPKPKRRGPKRPGTNGRASIGRR